MRDDFFAAGILICWISRVKDVQFLLRARDILQLGVFCAELAAVMMTIESGFAGQSSL